MTRLELEMASKTVGRKTFACTEGPNNHVGHGKCQAVWCRCECHAAKPEQIVTFSYQQTEGKSQVTGTNPCYSPNGQYFYVQVLSDQLDPECVGEVVGYSADRISGLAVA